MYRRKTRSSCNNKISFESSRKFKQEIKIDTLTLITCNETMGIEQSGSRQCVTMTGNVTVHSV